MSDSHFLRTVRKMLLKDMLKTVPGDWKVLVLDELTTRVISSACKMSDILDEGVTLVEDLNKRRQPMHDMPGIYFVSPTPKSIKTICNDFQESPLYQSVHVFFSSKVSPADISELRKHPRLVERLRTLKEVGCEFMTVDSRTFTTDQPRALCELFGDSTAGTSGYEEAIGTAAARLATVFAALDEFPSIRYRAGKPPADGDPPGGDSRAAAPQRLAAKLHEHLTELQHGSQLPQAETCDLIILDRTIDPVAPVIHEWTYEAMAYDLLPLEGDIYKYESENRKGEKETREGLLEERDSLWVSLRHMFIADASMKLNSLLADFRTQNKAAQAVGSGELTPDHSKLKGVVQSLGEYNQGLSKLSLHIDIAAELNRITRDVGLDSVGKLEQDLVFGDATSKEIIDLLSKRQDLEWLDKVRLLMCYVATHPEKLDAAKAKQWQKLANLKPEYMHTIRNLEYLGVAVSKREAKSALSFGSKKKRQTRKVRAPDNSQEQWELSRFQPLLSEVVEDLAKGKLPEADYPYIVKPSGGAPSAAAGSARAKQSSVGWARRAAPQSSDLDVGGIKLQGKRLIVFVLGGVTRGEMRTSFTMSKQLGRDVLLGSTSIESPKSFVKRVYELSAMGDTDQ
uniref:Syntaxin-binding protein 1 n=2 Tax=Tetraselmis sp. GSL018 TaxID=582737 RepID=A0A061S1I1_9CHLO|mmetsp:Transcript_13362/g.31627  ORF Transcript_13362/g.31627 Transcript_13362/m.31627 type:complete len:624 (-) Transcript_13362:242-2113(-)